ncbi:lytic transglycosylase domain-containing protein [Acidiphilium sp. C61]|jgi:membrane-bound lytic murein transglycosylase B|uniref:lytic murein transglycosylase n=1 Tax=Acidiphilium sp. C61 TaxID=1671485 RepID=UPI00157B9922|nr:lytic murein transglycosylase [Acidiphilium sp. C61]
MKRRFLLAALPCASALVRPARAAGFEDFIHELEGRARRAGVPSHIAFAALSGLKPNQEVIRHETHQPEFTLTWAQYSARVVTQTRVAAGKAAFAAHRGIIEQVRARFGVAAAPIMGIWGIETDFGHYQGDFNVIDALATLAWYKNSSYFGREAIAAMRIVSRGDVRLSELRGSWAGAMGQPQFMPSIYLSTAVSYSGHGQPNIWTSVPDTMASIANYMRKSHWRLGLPSSEPVLVPPHLNAALAGRDHVLPLAQWQALGVHRLAPARHLPANTPASLLLPDGPSGEAFLAFGNFRAIRSYNPSDLYALAVGELGRRILA